MGKHPKILVGADPELFMVSPNSGTFISANDISGGPRVPRHQARAIQRSPFGAIQSGTARSWSSNIDPCSNVEDFLHHISHVRSTLESYVPGYNVVATPVAVFDEEYFTWEVPSFAQALGCDPDYNGWTTEQNPRPDPGGKPMRTASGHVHIGWTEGMDISDSIHFELCCRVARQMDYYLGIHSLLWDQDGTRRKLYGKAGAFRPKSYGTEYRVLSNRWLSSPGD